MLTQGIYTIDMQVPPFFNFEAIRVNMYSMPHSDKANPLGCNNSYKT